MNRDYDQALLRYLNHCDQRMLFVIHPLSQFSDRVDGDWHLRNRSGLIAIVTDHDEVLVETVASQSSRTFANLC